MEKLNSEELLNVNGGAIRWGVIAGIAAAVTFIIGIIDGFVRPLRCN